MVFVTNEFVSSKRHANQTNTWWKTGTKKAIQKAKATGRPALFQRKNESIQHQHSSDTLRRYTRQFVVELLTIKEVI